MGGWLRVPEDIATLCYTLKSSNSVCLYGVPQSFGILGPNQPGMFSQLGNPMSSLHHLVGGSLKLCINHLLYWQDETFYYANELKLKRQWQKEKFFNIARPLRRSRGPLCPWRPISLLPPPPSHPSTSPPFPEKSPFSCASLQMRLCCLLHFMCSITIDLLACTRHAFNLSNTVQNLPVRTGQFVWWNPRLFKHEIFTRDITPSNRKQGQIFTYFLDVHKSLRQRSVYCMLRMTKCSRSSRIQNMCVCVCVSIHTCIKVYIRTDILWTYTHRWAPMGKKHRLDRYW